MDKESVVGESSPFMLLLDAGSLVQRDIGYRLRKLRLSVDQQRILCLVYFAHERLSTTFLAAILLVEPYSVRNALKGLVSRRLVTLHQDGEDKRVSWLALTKLGREVAEAATAEVLDAAQELNSSTHLPEKEHLLNAVSRVRDKGVVLAEMPVDVRQEALQRVWGERHT